MGSELRAGFMWLGVAVLLLAACAPSPVGSGAPSQTSAEGTPAKQKRITVGLSGEINVLDAFAVQGGASTSDKMQELLNAGFVLIDDQALPQPQLAEAVPTIANGLWKVFPDGRMETTWKLKAGITWHDGTPFTTDDLLFTAMVDGDPDVPHKFSAAAYAALEAIEALDNQTLTLRWKSPFVDADKMFSSLSPFRMPMPKHILERAYLADKSTFVQHPHWTTEYVGTGPYRLREFNLTGYLLLDANPDYVLGRPKIDQIEVKTIADPNTRGLSFLAGTVEFGIGSNILSPEQAIELASRWRDGRVEYAAGDWVRMMPQFLDPSPPIVANVQFKRAMYHALDRQQMVDTLMHGNATVMSDMLAPNQSQYREIQARLVPYEYDPRKAAQMIEALGYLKGPSGTFGDATGQRLAVELRTVDRAELGLSTQAVVADYWQRIGVGVDQVVVPAARQFDNEYRGTFPAFEVVVNGPFDAAGLRRQHSSSAKTPQSNFVGSATPRYKNAEYDALIERYLVTIPIEERIQIMGQIIHHYWDNVVEMPLYSLPQPIPIATRLIGVGPYRAPMGSMLGNVHQWDIQS